MQNAANQFLVRRVALTIGSPCVRQRVNLFLSFHIRDGDEDTT